MIAEITAAYIHIPFCRRRCYYCDFPVTVIGDRDSEKMDRSQLMRRYVDALCREIRLTANDFPTSGLHTLFFGGGTPSLLPIEELDKILTTLDHYFPISPAAEISIEIDPGTFDIPQLKAYQQLGINRYSLGVQSFQDELLAKMGRTHRREDIHRAIAQLRQVGIDNISFDLISGLPDQSLADWETTLENAIALCPSHLSCYDLIIEPQTPFQRQADAGNLNFPPNETSAQMYRLTQQRLTAAGYTHYEISNYAQPYYQCHHNRNYWENRPYYGFGMGAASYLGGKRFTRPSKRQPYYAWVETLNYPDHDLTSAVEQSWQDQLLETLMLGLRLKQGINLSAIAQQFGQETVNNIVEPLQAYPQWVEISQGQLRLQDPEGMLFSNTVLAELFAAFSD